MVKPSRRRAVVGYLCGVYRVSQRRACRVARLAAATNRYQSRRDPRKALRLRLREIAPVRVRYGYRKIRVLLNREGWQVGKKLVYRLYHEEGLALRYQARRKRRMSVNRRERIRPTGPNQVWSMDFVADQLADGPANRRTLTLRVIQKKGAAHGPCFGANDRAIPGVQTAHPGCGQRSHRY